MVDVFQYTKMLAFTHGDDKAIPQTFILNIALESSAEVRALQVASYTSSLRPHTLVA
jgi:hypothetical protein